MVDLSRLIIIWTIIRWDRLLIKVDSSLLFLYGLYGVGGDSDYVDGETDDVNVETNI